MKKIAVLLLLVLTIAGCGKIESGTITIKNNSDHSVTCGVGENWTVKHYDIPAGHTKQVDWKNYVLVWNEKPKNLVTRKKIGDTVIFENNKPSYIVYIENKTGQPITINDEVLTYDGKDEYGNDKYKYIPDYALADNLPPPPPPLPPPDPPRNEYVTTLIIPTSTKKEYAFYFSLRAENFQHSSMAGCTALFNTKTIVRAGKFVTIQMIELIKK